MDLREKKTKRSIHNAFLQLRAHKPLERITIKELTQLAEISKATFYLHYHDIYDLSAQMQEEVIKEILSDIEQPDLFVSDKPLFTRLLFQSFAAHQNLTDILFSGNQASVLPIRIEQGIREHIFRILPEKKDDVKFNILLTYQIQGGYFAYTQHRRNFGDEIVVNTIVENTGISEMKL